MQNQAHPRLLADWLPLLLAIALAGQIALFLAGNLAQTEVVFVPPVPEGVAHVGGQAHFGVGPQGSFGLDYMTMWLAGDVTLAGGNPYEAKTFFTPPISVLLGVLVRPFDPTIGAYVYAGINLIFVVASVLLVARALGTMDRKWWYLGIIGLFYPLYFLVDRGNLDGWMMASIALVAVFNQRAWVAGLALPFGIAVKAYSLPLVFPLMLGRRWRVLLMAGAVLALSVVAFWDLWADFLSHGAERARGTKADENISAFAPFLLIGNALEPLVFGAAAKGLEQRGPAAIFGAVFGAIAVFVPLAMALRADLLRWRASPHAADGPTLCRDILLYVPFLVAVPFGVYPYSGVSMLLLLPLAERLRRDGLGGRSDWLLLAGMALLGFQASAWAGVLQSPLAHLPPGIGTILILIWVAVIKSRVAAGPAK